MVRNPCWRTGVASTAGVDPRGDAANRGLRRALHDLVILDIGHDTDVPVHACIKADAVGTRRLLIIVLAILQDTKGKLLDIGQTA